MVTPSGGFLILSPFVWGFIMPAGCFLDITEVMSLVLDGLGNLGHLILRAFPRGVPGGSSGGT